MGGGDGPTTPPGAHPDEACPEDSFACRDDGHCFPRRFRCDGTPDCKDASDEGKENRCDFCTVIKSTYLYSNLT